MGKKILTFILSATFFYILLELLFPTIIMYLPLRLQPYLPHTIRPLAQSSKTNTIPKDYIMIIGDSYAQGAGDWYIDNNKWESGSYSSAHLIHYANNIDVMAIGMSGASSITGLVTNPLMSLKEMRKRFLIEDPDHILVYFYEGNDVNNNITDLTLRPSKYFSYQNEKEISREKFLAHLDEISISDPSWIKSKLLFARFFKSLFINSLFNSKSSKNIVNNTFAKKIKTINKGDKNVIKIRDSFYKLSESLQSPALGLNEKELNVGIDVFSYCLDYLKKSFPISKISIVYIPSPLMCYYLLTDVSIEQHKEDSSDIYDKENCNKRSNYIVKRIREIADKHKLTFINPIDFLKSSNEILHGPKDKRHFNKKGYERLSSFISRYI